MNLRPLHAHATGFRPYALAGQPHLISVTLTGSNTCVLVFSEAVYANYLDMMTFFLTNGSYADGVLNNPAGQGTTTITATTYHTFAAGQAANINYSSINTNYQPNTPGQRGIYSVATGLEIQEVNNVAVTNNIPL